VDAPVGPNVSQVPPPVTALDVPRLAGETNVPEPVSVILRFEGAIADAIPPALKVKGVVVKLKLMMSQRTCSASRGPALEPIGIAHATANIRTQIARNHRLWIFMFSLLSLVVLFGEDALSWLEPKSKPACKASGYSGGDSDQPKNAGSDRPKVGDCEDRRAKPDSARGRS
jgi:hypothetical protein